MILALVDTAIGVLIISVIFSLPFIAIYVGYEVVWPKLAPYLRRLLPDDARSET